MIKGIFFDLFGTLFIYGDMKQSQEDWLHGLYTPLAEEANLTCTKETFAQHCEKFFAEGTHPPSRPTHLTIYERRLHALCQNLNLFPNASTFNRAITESIQPWQHHVPIDPETIPVLKKLNNQYTLGLVSNFDHAPYVHGLLQKHNLTPLFETIVVSGDIEIDKPAPEIFHHALNAVHLLPDQVAFVGDNPTADIQGALDVGMNPIWINRSKQHSNQTSISSNPKVSTISKLSQLLEILN